MKRSWSLLIPALLVVLPGPVRAAADPGQPDPKALLIDRAKTITVAETDPFTPHLRPTMRDTIDFGYYEVRDDGLNTDYPQHGICFIGSAVEEEVAGGPVTSLDQNRPNPFNPRTLIRFSLGAAGPARVVLYDALGRRVRILVNQSLKAGMHEVVWDGLDEARRPVASGVYWSQLELGGYSSSRKLMVVK